MRHFLGITSFVGWKPFKAKTFRSGSLSRMRWDTDFPAKFDLLLPKQRVCNAAALHNAPHSFPLSFKGNSRTMCFRFATGGNHCLMFTEATRTLRLMACVSSHGRQPALSAPVASMHSCCKSLMLCEPWQWHLQPGVRWLQTATEPPPCLASCRPNQYLHINIVMLMDISRKLFKIQAHT